jgi:uncharacterized protein YceK
MKVITRLVLIVVAGAVTGCGSFLGRMSQRPKPYPGFRFTTQELTSVEKPGIEQILWLDLPVSAAVDTLLLPIDALEASSDRARK